MEQNQYLRHLSTSTGVPSHLVRRRTIVETIVRYDRWTVGTQYDVLTAHA